MLRRPLLLAGLLGALASIPSSTAAGSSSSQLAKPRWLGGVEITEYWPAPERWFRGRLVAAPGIPGRHHVDWLYSGRGLAMEGDGVGLDGASFHIQKVGPQGWVAESGRRTVAGARGWTRGFPFWRALGWRTRQGLVTFPLAGGGWFNGPPGRYIEPKGVTFGLGPSRPLSFWRSVAVDPALIPLGSRIFAPALCDLPGRGWVVARDTGGAIIGRHLDLYRPAPPAPEVRPDTWARARIFVVPPEARLPRFLPSCDGSPVLGVS